MKGIYRCQFIIGFTRFEQITKLNFEPEVGGGISKKWLAAYPSGVLSTDWNRHFLIDNIVICIDKKKNYK